MLKGANAIVTGSTSGIGIGIAEALAAAGAHVMMNGLGDSGEIETTRSRLESEHGVKVLYSDANMLNRDEIVGMVERTRESLGSVDILINNAGIQHVEAIETFRRGSGTRLSPSTSPPPFMASARSSRK